MNKDKAIEKIKKCFALSKSANEHEAAQAMKQAQALMRAHRLTDADVALADVQESGINAPANLPKWQAKLAHVVAAAFGADWYLGGTWQQTQVVFYGLQMKSELAAYAYSVLLRQLKKARREYMATALKKVRLSKNKTYRADEFCTGWVDAVWRKVDVFANGLQEKALLERFTQQKGFGTFTPRETKPSSNAKKTARFDQLLGRVKGKDAQLHHAMNGAEEQKRLGV